MTVTPGVDVVRVAWTAVAPVSVGFVSWTTRVASSPGSIAPFPFENAPSAAVTVPRVTAAWGVGETACMAWNACTMPKPLMLSKPADSTSTAVVVRIVRICAAVSAGFADLRRPAIAPACGAAAEVP